MKYIREFNQFEEKETTYNKEKLTNYLKEVGFEEHTYKQSLIFKNGKDIFVLPKEECPIHNFIATRHQLVAMGYLDSKQEFDKMFSE